MDRREREAHFAKAFLGLRRVSPAVVECIGNEYDIGPVPDKISDLFFGMVQITSAMQSRVADQ